MAGDDYLEIEDSVPAQLPEFAVDDIVDSTSGQNNIHDPHPDQKSYGWFPFRKRPERGVMNWLHRHTHLCIKWLVEVFYPAVDAALHAIHHRLLPVEQDLSSLWSFVSNSFDFGEVELEMEAVGTTFTSATGGTLAAGKINFNMKYTLVNKVVTLTNKQLGGNYSQIGGVLAGTCTFLRINIRSGFTWPAKLNTPTFDQCFVGKFENYESPIFADMIINRDISDSVKTSFLFTTYVTGSIGQTISWHVQPVIYGVN